MGSVARSYCQEHTKDPEATLGLRLGLVLTQKAPGKVSFLPFEIKSLFEQGLSLQSQRPVQKAAP